MKAGLVAREEWDFTAVPDDEIEACYFYEHARERDDIKNVVKSWRKKLAVRRKEFDANDALQARLEKSATEDIPLLRAKFGADSLQEKSALEYWQHLKDHLFSSEIRLFRDFGDKMDKLTDMECGNMLMKIEGFPATPWQKLKRAGKRFRVLTTHSFRHLKGGIREYPLYKAISIANGEERIHRTEEVVCLHIDWSGGIEKVLNAFELLARARYSKRKHKKKPRETFREALKQLGVLRLKRELKKWADVQEHTNTILGCKLYGDDLAVWRKARLASMGRIKSMFPIPSKWRNMT